MSEGQRDITAKVAYRDRRQEATNHAKGKRFVHRAKIPQNSEIRRETTGGCGGYLALWLLPHLQHQNHVKRRYRTHMTNTAGQILSVVRLSQCGCAALFGYLGHLVLQNEIADLEHSNHDQALRRNTSWNTWYADGPFAGKVGRIWCNRRDRDDCFAAIAVKSSSSLGPEKSSTKGS
jgi:hypothetical protein